jgi:molecular chaperone DnaK (HSP70)
MSFILGLDIGTASGAGATKRGGRVQPCALGDHTATLPAVVVLHDDGSIIVGDAAEKVAGLELTRVAREVRFDPAQQTSPIVVAGQAHTPHELLSSLYQAMVERVCLAHNATPDHVVLTHPALPTGMRFEMVDRIAQEMFPGALLVPEPVAAAVKLACDGALPADCIVAVYDFGGGTFDVALVRREGDRFSVLGEPSGIPDFGGIDVDDLVLDHVNRALDGAVTRLDLDDPQAVAALTRLRAKCRDAKERLSYETDVTIDASLDSEPALVRLSRGELEEWLRPGLERTADVVEQMINDAGLRPGDVDALALVGGSSRIPLVAELLPARTDIPVVVDPYPELTVALGAAQMVDDDAPSSSVFPMADLALPSLSALSGASSLVSTSEASASPSGGTATVTAHDDLLSTGWPAGAVDEAEVTGGARGAEGGVSGEFEALMARGQRLDVTEPEGRLENPDDHGPDRGLSEIVGQGLNPKVGLALVGCLLAVLFLSVALLAGRSKSPDAARTADQASGVSDAEDTSEDGEDASATSPSSSSSTSSSSTGSTGSTSVPEDGGVVPPGTDPPGGGQPPSTNGNRPPTSQGSPPTTRPRGTTTSTPTTQSTTTSSSSSTSSSTSSTTTTTTEGATTTSSTSSDDTTAGLQPTLREEPVDDSPTPAA